MVFPPGRRRLLARGVFPGGRRDDVAEGLGLGAWGSGRGAQSTGLRAGEWVVEMGVGRCFKTLRVGKWVMIW
jgi:hypothetical protein